MSDNQRIRHIDAWRFIAVSLVILAHFIEYSDHLNKNLILNFFIPYGQFGVSIFFVISGFVICRGLVVESHDTSSVCLKAFYVRRTFRIMPPLWLFLFALAICGATGIIFITSKQLGNSALFLCNIKFLGDCSLYLGHTWSLAYEEQFYILFPFFFIVANLSHHLRILLFCYFAILLFSLICLFIGINGGYYYLMRMSYLIIGCISALYYQRVFLLCQRLQLKYWISIGVGLFICVGVLPRDLDLYLKVVLYPALTVLMVLGTPVAHPKIKAFFENPLISYLGKISYSVYLWQQLATAPWPSLSRWWTVLFICAVWLFAHFSYKYFERPLIGLAHRWSDAIKQRNLAKRVPVISSI